MTPSNPELEELLSIIDGETPEIYESRKAAYRKKLERYVSQERQKAARKVTRLEIIDHTKPLEDGGGRTVLFYDKRKQIELDYQDDGRTLKIFLSPRGQSEKG